jgi:hypothetical protein
MIKQLAVMLLLSSTSLSAADYSTSKELYMPNESGGYVVLTVDPCQIAEAKKQGFDSRAYATETDTEQPITHEGCWNSPDTSAAPKAPGVTIIPLVNLWFDGDIVFYPQNMFGPEKRRWDATLPSTIKPNV